MNFKVLRGQRVQDQLDEESTYNQLYTGIVQGFPGTTKRQNATDEVVVQNIMYLPYVNDNTLRVEAKVSSGPNQYEPIIVFRNVNFVDATDPRASIIRAKDNQEYGIGPISLTGSRLKVRCTCLDFHYRFATYNHQDGSLQGNPPPPYIDRDPNRGPVNPTQTPGVCKHLIKVVDELKRSRIVT